MNNKYEFKATRLIAETFEDHGIKFGVESHGGVEMLLAGFPIECGPNVLVSFASHDDDNDVSIRLFSLLSGIPDEKRLDVMTACNELNRKARYIKCYIDSDGDVNIEYDIPVRCPDEAIGEVALEMLLRLKKILDGEYGHFMRALYAD